MLLLLPGCSAVKLAAVDEQMARGEYFDASRNYRKIYNRLKTREERPLKGEVAFKMAQAHAKLGENSRAAAAYQNAIRFEYPDSTASLGMAVTLHADGKYERAVTAYETYLELDPSNAAAQNGLRGARYALAHKGDKTRYIVRQAKLFNSSRSDFAPAFSGSDVLYFTTTNNKVKGDGKSEITGMKKGDIWMARKDEHGAWQRPVAVEGELNTEFDEGICTITPDGSTMYLTRAIRSNSSSTGVDIYTSQRSDAKWSAPVLFEITADTLSNYGHPSVDPSGTWLYFTSDMPGMGGHDIWRINLKDRVGSLENMGEWINTPGDEMFPYAYSDSVLYFSSNGHPGYGGLDLFRATLTPSGGWKVENMGLPLNSPADDFGMAFAPGTNAGYFSSNRGDGRGYDHLYSFELPDLRILISGWVVDHDEEPVTGAVIRIVGNDGSNQKAIAKDDGSFSFPLQRGVDYVMMAGAPGYLNARQEFTSDTAEVDAEYGIDFMLASINKPNIVENIFYDYDKATLRPESTAALDELVVMLRDNPNITIEMASHTDRVGSDEYNIALSDRRAKAVVDYLIAKGISPDRLQYAGYGKSRPKTVTKRIAREYPQFEEGQVLDEAFVLGLSDEDRAAADQINRRTEFEVLSIDYQIY